MEPLLAQKTRIDGSTDSFKALGYIKDKVRKAHLISDCSPDKQRSQGKWEPGDVPVVAPTLTAAFWLARPSGLSRCLLHSLPPLPPLP